MMVSDDGWVIQAGAIPFRTSGDGDIDVLLIRRADKKKWGIPKGLIEEDQSLADAARAEAIEEAGAVGELSRRAIGTFTFEKPDRRCVVHVFLLHVQESLDEYPEKNDRLREWFPLEEAATLVRREEVAEFIRKLPDCIRRGPNGRISFVPLGRRAVG